MIKKLPIKKMQITHFNLKDKLIKNNGCGQFLTKQFKNKNYVFYETLVFFN